MIQHLCGGARTPPTRNVIDYETEEIEDEGAVMATNMATKRFSRYSVNEYFKKHILNIKKTRALLTYEFPFIKKKISINMLIKQLSDELLFFSLNQIPTKRYMHRCTRLDLLVFILFYF